MKKNIIIVLLIFISLVVNQVVLAQPDNTLIKLRINDHRSYQVLSIEARKKPDSLFLLLEKKQFIKLKNIFTTEVQVYKESYYYDRKLDNLVLVKNSYLAQEPSLFFLIIVLSLLLIVAMDYLFKKDLSPKGMNVIKYVDKMRYLLILNLINIIANLSLLVMAIIGQSACLILLTGTCLLISAQIYHITSPLIRVKKPSYLFIAYYLVIMLILIVVF